MPGYSLPAEYRVPKPVLVELGLDEPTVRSHLEANSAGRCALGDEPLPLLAAEIQVDHKQAIRRKGKSELPNLALVCRKHNRQKSDLPFDYARRLIRLAEFCYQRAEASFDDVSKDHFHIVQANVQAEMLPGEVRLTFGSTSRTFPTFVDPATSVPYFFAELPLEFVKNDQLSQPRHIEPDHVDELAQDFELRPVHEPSSARLVLLDSSSGVSEILQFDGQHKTVAQMMIGRKSVQMKIYVEPSVQMIRELVEAIQNRIKKRPLSKSASLRKIEEIFKDDVLNWLPSAIEKSEKEFHNHFAPEIQDVKKAQIIDAFRQAIMADQGNHMSRYIETIKVPGQRQPITDKNLIKHVLSRFMTEDLQSDDMTAPGSLRELERANIVSVLSQVAEEMFASWDTRVPPKQYSSDQLRAQRFALGGAIGWWAKTFVKGLRLTWSLGESEESRLFRRKLTPEQEDDVREAVKISLNWPIWANPSQNLIDAWRSNTLRRVERVMNDEGLDSKFNDSQLQKAILGARPPGP